MKRFLPAGCLLWMFFVGDALATCRILQSTAGTTKIGPFISDTTFNTAVTSLTIQKADVRVSKNGSNMTAASANQGVSDAGAPHDELGVYDLSYNTTDTDTEGILRFDIKESGALAVWKECEIYAPVATLPDIWNFPKTSVDDIDGIGYWLKTNLDGSVVNSAGQIDVGTAQAGANTSITLASVAAPTAEWYRYKRIVLVTGTGSGQSAIIESYNQTTKVATISCEGASTKAWFVNPDSTTGYVILPRNR